jgi:hypothetical protein
MQMRTDLAIAGFTINMRSRSRRRALVLLVYLLLSAMLAASLRWVPSTLGSVGWLIPLIALINRMIFGGLTTRGLVRPFSSSLRPVWFSDDPPPSSRIDRWFWRRSPSRKDLQADERDDRRRDRVHYISYRILAFLTMLVWGLFEVVRSGPLFGTRGLPFNFALAVALAVPMLALTLPQAILLWTEPDMEEPNES